MLVSSAEPEDSDPITDLYDCHDSYHGSNEEQQHKPDPNSVGSAVRRDTEGSIEVNLDFPDGSLDDKVKGKRVKDPMEEDVEAFFEFSGKVWCDH